MSNSLYCLTFNSYDVNLENLALDLLPLIDVLLYSHHFYT